MTDAPNYDEIPDHREMTRCAAPFRKAQASIKAIIDDMRRVPHSSAQFLADCLTDLLGDVAAFVKIDRYDAGPNDEAETKAIIEAVWWKVSEETPPDWSRLEAMKRERLACSHSVAGRAVQGAIVNTTGGA
jgi:hypothetical protein